MRKSKKRGIFTVVLLYSLAVCVLSAAAAVGCGMLLYKVSAYLGERNAQQKKEFDTHKNTLAAVDAQYAARFEPLRPEALKTKLAQRGFTALLDPAQIEILYGYDEIRRILANQASEPKPLAAANPKSYNWPAIHPVSMVYDTSTCTTMVEFAGGENKNEQKRQVWKWTRRDGKWIPLSFSGYFVANDVEISKQGISFILSPKHDTTLAKLFVLKKA
jgi:hypothetical protein